LDDQKNKTSNNKLEDENIRLRNAVAELSVLNDIATTITSTQPIEELVDVIVKKCVKHLKVEQGAVMLLNEKDKDKPFQTMIRKHDSKVDSLPYRLDNQLTGWMLKNQVPLLANNLKEDERFKDTIDNDTQIRSILSVPLTLKGKMLGLLSVFNKFSESGFSENDKRLLSIIASQSAQVIENARLYKEEQSLMVMQQEMKLARETQLSLLPKEIPAIKNYKIAATTISANEVGGDYYDIIKINDDQYAFCIGDVSGKGLPAAMLMANIQATLRAQILNGLSCTDSLFNSNNLLNTTTDPTKFVTLFLGILNKNTNEIYYSNGGHDCPFYFSKGKTSRLGAGGLLLGAFPNSKYEQDKIIMNPGDLLLLFSDGITEAMNNERREFSEEKLIEVFNINSDADPEMLIKKIILSVKEHAGSAMQSDDMTLLVIKRDIA